MNEKVGIFWPVSPDIHESTVAEQKKRVREYPCHAAEWIKLGCLYEERLAETQAIIKRTFIAKHIVFLIAILILLSVFGATKNNFYIKVFNHIDAKLLLLFLAVEVGLIVYIITHRYPASGYKYFKKAIAVDPNYGEAYMHLGVIALRRGQKKKACLLFEHAIALGVENSKIERQLHSIYGKEFFAFFRNQKEEETQLQEENSSLRKEILRLQNEIAALESRFKVATNKTNQVKVKAKRSEKLISEQLHAKLDDFRQEYEEKIDSIERDMASIAEEKELAQCKFSQLTAEIIEAKARRAKQAYGDAGRRVKEALGAKVWQALSKDTKRYLATAEQTYAHLAGGSAEGDFSLVGLELCKALEFEVNRRLVAPFVAYLGEKRVQEFLRISRTGDRKGKPVYFTYLSKVVDRNNFQKIKTLTLGQYHFVLNLVLQGDYSLREYKRFLHEIQPRSNKINPDFLETLATVTHGYRNTIAHNTPMSLGECEQLRQLVFAGRNALIKRLAVLQEFDAERGC